MFSVADFTAIINQTLPEPQAGLLSGILFGTKTTLSPTLTDALITTGTLHIVALSGMNITILTKIVYDSIVGIIPRRIASFWTIGIITGFICFVGPSPSLVRAGVMGGITLLGTITGRPRVPLCVWGVAIAGMLIVRPTFVQDLSFQLSALASLGMILFGPSPKLNQKTQSFWETLKVCINNDLHTTLAAQVGTIPLIFVTFHRISLIAPFTNVCIGWTIPIITVFGMLLVCLGYIWLPLGQIIAYGVWVFLTYIIGVITWTGNMPFASVGW